MENKTSPERIKQLMEIMRRGNLVPSFVTPEEKSVLIEEIIKNENEELASEALIIFSGGTSEENKLTSEEREQLKQIILKTKNVDTACSALLNLSNGFTKEELFIIRKIAYETKNEYWAYHIFRNDCIALMQEPSVRANLRKIIMNTKNPERAFEFLCAQEEMRRTYDDYAQSLEYTDDDVERFKKVIISSGNPQWAFYLLRTAEPKGHDDSICEDEGLIELTSKDRVALKRTIIESQSPEWAYSTLCSISDLTSGERIVLNGIFISRIENPSTACHALCNTNFIHTLNDKERNKLRKLAVKVQDKYDADKALKYIYDLTSEERSTLEKIMYEQKTI